MAIRIAQRKITFTPRGVQLEVTETYGRSPLPANGEVFRNSSFRGPTTPARGPIAFTEETKKKLPEAANSSGAKALAEQQRRDTLANASKCVCPGPLPNGRDHQPDRLKLERAAQANLGAIST